MKRLRTLQPGRLTRLVPKCRFNSLASTVQTAEQSPEDLSDRKAFRMIELDINNRMHRYNEKTKLTASQGADTITCRPCDFETFSGPFQVGDLVDSKKHGLAIIVREPNDEEKLLICGMSGAVSAVSRYDLLQRLSAQVFDAKILRESVKMLKLEGVEQRVMATSVRLVLGPFLRKFELAAVSKQGKIEAILQKLVPQARLTINVPYFELCGRVQQELNGGGAGQLGGSFPPEFDVAIDPRILYIVHDRLKTKFFNSVLVEDGNLANVTIMTPGQTKKFTMRYALNDFNSTDLMCQSGAIKQFRTNESCKDTILTPEVGLSMLDMDIPHGPKFAKLQNRFLRYGMEQFQEQAQKVAQEFPDSAVKTRRNMQDKPVYCIDASDAEEIDDGISLEQLDSCRYRVGLHIADPSSCLLSSEHGRQMLEHLSTRSSTSYLPAAVIPMFDKSFTDKLGLVPGSPRRCLSIYYTYDMNMQDITPGSYEVCPETVKNLVALTYDDVDSRLANPTAEHYQDLKTLQEISNQQRALRVQHGALSLDIPQPSVSGEGAEIGLVRTKFTESRKLVEEMMISGNHSVAAWAQQSNVPIIYRSQGIHFKTNSPAKSPKSVAESLLLLKQLNGASLSTQPTPHLSLGLKSYTHATSPLRRFHDVLTHWQIHSSISGLPLFSSSDMQRLAVRIHSTQSLISRAQRQSQHYWMLKLIEKESGVGPMFECTLTNHIRDGRAPAYCLDYGVNAIVESTEMLKAGTGVQCTLLDCRPDNLFLRLKVESVNN